MDGVTEGTDGAVTFDYYESGTLHPPPEALSALSSGLTDLTFVSNGYFPDQLPVSNWDDVVVQHSLNDFGYPNTNIAALASRSSTTREKSALNEMAQAGFVPLLPILSGPTALSCSKEFKSPGDLEGWQVRVANASAKGENEALGMVGVFMPPTEQYEALQRGVLDCAVNAATTLLPPASLRCPLGGFPNTAPSSGANWVISTETRDGLAPEIQTVMRNARQAPMHRFAKDTPDQYNKIVAAAEKPGGGVVDAKELNSAVKKWWSDQPDPSTDAPDAVSDPNAEIKRINAITGAWWDFTVDKLGVETDHDDILKILNRGSGVVQDWSAWTNAVADGLGKQ